MQILGEQTYQVLSNGLPLVNQAADTLRALLLWCQLREPNWGSRPFALPGLRLLTLCISNVEIC